MFSLLWQVLQQRLSNFYKQNFVWASETNFFENPHLNPESTDRRKILVNAIETKSSHFFGMYCNKFWETFTNRTASRQVKSRISKALTKIQKTLFGANYLVDSNETKCSRFVDMYCNKLWATFTNKTASRYLKSSIHENTHQTPENTDRSKIFDNFQWNKVVSVLGISL